MTTYCEHCGEREAVENSEFPQVLSDQIYAVCYERFWIDVAVDYGFITAEEAARQRAKLESIDG